MHSCNKFQHLRCIRWVEMSSSVHYREGSLYTLSSNSVHAWSWLVNLCTNITFLRPGFLLPVTSNSGKQIDAHEWVSIVHSSLQRSVCQCHQTTVDVCTRPPPPNRVVSHVHLQHIHTVQINILRDTLELHTSWGAALLVASQVVELHDHINRLATKAQQACTYRLVNGITMLMFLH